MGLRVSLGGELCPREVRCSGKSGTKWHKDRGDESEARPNAFRDPKHRVDRSPEGALRCRRSLVRDDPVRGALDVTGLPSRPVGTRAWSFENQLYIHTLPVAVRAVCRPALHGDAPSPTGEHSVRAARLQAVLCQRGRADTVTNTTAECECAGCVGLCRAASLDGCRGRERRVMLPAGDTTRCNVANASYRPPLRLGQRVTVSDLNDGFIPQ